MEGPGPVGNKPFMVFERRQNGRRLPRRGPRYPWERNSPSRVADVWAPKLHGSPRLRAPRPPSFAGGRRRAPARCRAFPRPTHLPSAPWRWHAACAPPPRPPPQQQPRRWRWRRRVAGGSNWGWRRSFMISSSPTSASTPCALALPPPSAFVFSSRLLQFRARFWLTRVVSPTHDGFRFSGTFARRRRPWERGAFYSFRRSRGDYTLLLFMLVVWMSVRYVTVFVRLCYKFTVRPSARI
jgi:hypothetical protein